MTPARQVLERLLRRGERARARGGDEQVTLAMTPASCPEYAGLDTLDALESFHAEIALAARAGAITADHARNGGDSAALKRLALANLDRLGHHLGIRLLSEHAGSAAALLAPWQATHPVLVLLLQAWAQGRKVRSCGPEAASEVADAITAVESRRRDEHEERILRRESVRLFGDSKRLERLTPWLDLLTSGELAATGLSNEDIWSSLGLRREPQPMLVAGCGTARLRDGAIALCRPYLGLPVDAVTSIDTEARYLLTIENLASFHDAARALSDAPGLLIYTAGMPSPAWRALYARILHALPGHTLPYHWGDIDEGGFRIAATLAGVATGAGKTLRPWLMSRQSLPVATLASKTPPESRLAEMQRWALKAGWDDIARDLLQSPVLLEQEAIDPVLPHGWIAGALDDEFVGTDACPADTKTQGPVSRALSLE